MFTMRQLAMSRNNESLNLLLKWFCCIVILYMEPIIITILGILPYSEYIWPFFYLLILIDKNIGIQFVKSYEKTILSLEHSIDSRINDFNYYKVSLTIPFL